MSFRGWYENVYPELSGAGLWLRGGELNTLPESAWEARPFRILFARLSTYQDTADSFTHGLLYQIAAAVPGVYPDLAYLPPALDLPLFRRDQVPWLLGTQSKRGPRDFQAIGFSLSVAQELLNLPAMLRESGIPLSKRERLARPELPLLVLGGASALFSSVAWGDDPWIDAVFVGESDIAIGRLLEILRDGAAAQLDKATLLARLGEVPGVLEPDSPRLVRRAACHDLDAAQALERAPVPFLRERTGIAQLQLSQGCPCFCSFCAESWDRKPYRERNLPGLLALARRLKAGMAVESLELFSSSANAHRDFQALVEELAPEFCRLKLKSLRFDLLAQDPSQVQVLQVLGKTSLTCGLEGISPRLRRYLRKSLSDQDLQRALELILTTGVRELKVFLIATGLEQEEDFLAFEELLGQIKRLRQRSGRATRCIFSMTPLVRFPWTPLEFEDAPPLVTSERTVRRTAQLVRATGLEFREAADLGESWVEQLLVRAHLPAVATALLRALEQTGFLYYRRVERSFVIALQKSLSEAGLGTDELLRGSPPGVPRPWTCVETGVRREALEQALAQARAFIDEGYCLGRPGVTGHCLGCGACTAAEAASVTSPRRTSAGSAERLRQRLRQVRQAEQSVSFRVEAGPSARGLPRRVLAASLLQSLLDHCPSLASAFRRYGEAYFELEGEPVWLEGAEVLTLVWESSAQPRLAALAADAVARAAVDQLLGGWGRWLGLAPDGWMPSELRLSAPYPFAPDSYLSGLGLKFTRRRDAAPGTYWLEIAPASRRKGLVEELTWTQLGDGSSEVRLRPGPKLRLDELARRAFQTPSPEQWVRVRAQVIGP